MMKKLNKIIFIISFALFIILIFTAIIFYPNYGKGIGYVVNIVFPIISIGIGLLAKRTSKWWIILLVFCTMSLIYMLSISVSDILHFIPFLLIYIATGCIVGINSRKYFFDDKQDST